MTTKHTKGKWRYFGSDNESYAVTNGDNVIAISGEEHNPDNEANAKLIASAPALLEALNLLLNDYANLDKLQGLSVEIAENAIKQATE